MKVFNLTRKVVGITSHFVHCPRCYKTCRVKPEIETNLGISPKLIPLKSFQFLAHFYNGLLYGNDLCCVLYFCKLNYMGLRPALISTYIQEGYVVGSEVWGPFGLSDIEMEYLIYNGIISEVQNQWKEKV